MEKILIRAVLILSSLSLSQFVVADEIGDRLQSVLDEYVEANPNVPGVVVSVRSSENGVVWQGAAGVATVGAQDTIDPARPVRLASTTKTYVAAAVLRLVEEGKLNLDDNLADVLSKHTLAQLEGDGYDVNRISVRQLLTHTGGMGDHFSDAYAQVVMEDPQRRWTKNEQLKLGMQIGDPVDEPGAQFMYSDLGYILLGEVIERRHGTGLAQAVRELLSFADLGLTSTWWEILEPSPATALPRLSQYWSELDTVDWHASLDLYGGGGLVANMSDLSRFYAALFEGEVFENAGTLVTLQSPGVTSLARPTWMQEGPAFYAYGMGVFVTEYRGYTVYRHGGFWGTEGGYAPALGLAWGWVVTQQNSREVRDQLTFSILDEFIDEQVE